MKIMNKHDHNVDECDYKLIDIFGNYAALCGNMTILKWLVQNGFKFSEITCFDAARNGHLDMLKWLVQNGCKWVVTSNIIS
jgi:hypothetical protein